MRLDVDVSKLRKNICGSEGLTLPRQPCRSKNGCVAPVRIRVCCTSEDVVVNWFRVAVGHGGRLSAVSAAREFGPIRGHSLLSSIGIRGLSRELHVLFLHHKKPSSPSLQVTYIHRLTLDIRQPSMLEFRCFQCRAGRVLRASARVSTAPPSNRSQKIHSVIPQDLGVALRDELAFFRMRSTKWSTIRAE